MFYEIIVKNKAGMQVYKFATLEEAKEYASSYFKIDNLVPDVTALGIFGNKILIQKKDEEIPSRRVYWEDKIV